RRRAHVLGEVGLELQAGVAGDLVRDPPEQAVALLLLLRAAARAEVRIVGRGAALEAGAAPATRGVARRARLEGGPQPLSARPGGVGMRACSWRSGSPCRRRRRAANRRRSSSTAARRSNPP